MNNKHQIFLQMATAISQASKDPNTKVGCVIVSPDTRMITVGYNGFAPSVNDDLGVLSRQSELNGLGKDDLVIHAEINAIMNCPVRPEGWILYCTHVPCRRCATILTGSGIIAVHCYNKLPTTPHGSEKTEAILKEAGIHLQVYG